MRSPPPLLLLLLAPVGSSAGCAADADATVERPAPLPVQTRTAQPADGYEVRRRFTGLVRSRRRSELGFERGGIVVEVRVDEGDRVTPGQVLARLDTAPLRVRRRQLAAALREAEARVELSDVTAERLGQLADEQFASRQSSDEARFGLAAQRAGADRLRAQLAAIDLDLAKSKLVAPFAGTVARRRVDEGEVVAAGTPVLRFLERDRPEAVVGVPAAIAAQLAVGSTHALLRGEGRLPATVTAILEDVDPGTRTRSVVFALAPDADATAGEVVELELARRVDRRGFWLPLDALTEGLRGLWTVYTVSDDGRVEPEAVEIVYAERDRVFVRGTLEPEDDVVISGLHRVVPGQAVLVARAEGGDEAAP